MPCSIGRQNRYARPLRFWPLHLSAPGSLTSPNASSGRGRRGPGEEGGPAHTRSEDRSLGSGGVGEGGLQASETGNPLRQGGHHLRSGMGRGPGAGHEGTGGGRYLHRVHVCTHFQIRFDMSDEPCGRHSPSRLTPVGRSRPPRAVGTGSPGGPLRWHTASGARRLPMRLPSRQERPQLPTSRTKQAPVRRLWIW